MTTTYEQIKPYYIQTLNDGQAREVWYNVRTKELIIIVNDEDIKVPHSIQVGPGILERYSVNYIADRINESIDEIEEQIWKGERKR